MIRRDKGRSLDIERRSGRVGGGSHMTACSAAHAEIQTDSLERRHEGRAFIQRG